MPTDYSDTLSFPAHDLGTQVSKLTEQQEWFRQHLNGTLDPMSMTPAELWAQCSTVQDIIVKGNPPQDQRQVKDLLTAGLHGGLTRTEDLRSKIKSVLFTYDPLFEKSAQNKLYTQAARRLGTIPDDWVSIMDCTIKPEMAKTMASSYWPILTNKELVISAMSGADIWDTQMATYLNKDKLEAVRQRAVIHYQKAVSKLGIDLQVPSQSSFASWT